MLNGGLNTMNPSLPRKHTPVDTKCIQIDPFVNVNGVNNLFFNFIT